jgi:hypothetical protein
MLLLRPLIMARQNVPHFWVEVIPYGVVDLKPLESKLDVDTGL